MTNNDSWKWIPRSVEPTVEKWLSINTSVVLVRGQRRSGKSSTLKHCAQKLGKVVIELFVKSNLQDLVEDAQQVFQDKYIKQSLDITKAIVKSVKDGNVVLIEEIQNASNSFQVALQQACDTIAFQSMHFQNEWRTAGSLFLMGSLPSLVDTMIESRRNPLFQRISAKITIYQLDTMEMVQLFSFLQISDPRLQLSLHSIFGGKPHAYKLAYQAGLLKGDNTVVSEVVKEFFASELQADFNDAHRYCETELGATLAAGIKGVCTEKTKGQQIKKTTTWAGCDGFKILYNDLYRRYGVITPCFSISDLSIIQRFEITDPLLLLANEAANKEGIRREDIDRTPTVPPELFDRMEGPHFESWVREIAQDRHLLCSVPCFPHLPNADVCQFTPKLVWNIENTEIDIIASHPSTNTLIYGSCKRSSSKINYKNLEEHVNQLENDKNKFGKLLTFLKLDEGKTLLKKFYHFVPSIDEESRSTTEMPDSKQNIHIVTLTEMLQPFFDRVKPQSTEAQSVIVERDKRHKAEKVESPPQLWLIGLIMLSLFIIRNMQ